jgi:hypothetical protein
VCVCVCSLVCVCAVQYRGFVSVRVHSLCFLVFVVVVGVSRELGPRSVAFSVHHVHPFLQLGVVEECRR